MKLLINNKEVQYTTLTWKGSKYSPSRSIEFNLPSSAKDNNVPKVKVSSGDSVVLKDEKNNELFRGIIFRKEKSFKGIESSFIAFDVMIYLIKSKTAFNFKKTTPGQVMKKISGEAGFPLGTIVDADIRVTTDPYIDSSYYDIIIDVYKKASKITGRKYFPMVKKGRVYVINSGKEIPNYQLENYKNITDSHYSETIENIINKVIAVDDKGKRIGTYIGSDLEKFGTFQAVYQKEDGENVSSEAKKMFHGADLEAIIEALGDVRCISGYGVRVKEPFTGLVGLFYIDQDEHRWENGVYSMSLTLNFKNLMEENS